VTHSLHVVRHGRTADRYKVEGHLDFIAYDSFGRLDLIGIAADYEGFLVRVLIVLGPPVQLTVGTGLLVDLFDGFASCDSTTFNPEPTILPTVVTSPDNDPTLRTRNDEGDLLGRLLLPPVIPAAVVLSAAVPAAASAATAAVVPVAASAAAAPATLARTVAAVSSVDAVDQLFYSLSGLEENDVEIRRRRRSESVALPVRLVWGCRRGNTASLPGPPLWLAGTAPAPPSRPGFS
jgi:hypothetical protein